MRKELAVVEKVFLYNMKKSTLIILLFLACNFSNAQKQFNEKTYDTEYEEGCVEVTVSAGKPVFIVVYITNSYPNDSLIAVRELNELKNNFKGSNFYFLGKKGKIKINNSNKEVLELDEVNETYEKIIYWSGKKTSDYVEYDHLIQSSEYFSEILNTNKTSAYVEDYNAKVYSFRKQLVWEPNDQSKELSNKYLKYALFQQFKILGDFSEFLNLDFKGVKKVTINTTFKGAKNPWQEVYFNEEGNPIKAIVSTDDSDGKKATVLFEYKNSLLAKITISYKSSDDEVYEESTDIYYSNGNIITADDSRFGFYRTNSGFLTYKSYYAYETQYEFLLDTYELISDKEIKYTESSQLNNYILKFNSKDKFLPVVYTLRPERADDDVDKNILVLSQVDALNYVVTSKKVADTKIKYLNKNLIIEVLLINPDDISRGKKTNQYKFDFKYEYYK